MEITRNTTISLASVFAAAAVLWGVHTGSDAWVVTEAEAAQSHRSQVEQRIEDLEIMKIETELRSDLSERVKAEYTARIDLKLERLRAELECLRRGRIDCE